MRALVLLVFAASGAALLTGLGRRDDRLGVLGTPLLFGALVLGVWESACRLYGIPGVLLPPPSAIGAAFVGHGSILAADFMQTVLHAVLAGYLLGNSAGFLLALALDRVPFLARGVIPLSGLAGAMPIVGIAPIMVMWFGFDWQSKAAVVVAMTIFPMLVNAWAGLHQAGRIERDLMRSYGAGYWQTLFRLRLPAALPFIFNALKLNATLALIGAIVAEFFGTPIVGMGFRISTEAAKMNLDLVWAEILLAALIGAGSFAAIAVCERVVTFWHPSQRR